MKCDLRISTHKVPAAPMLPNAQTNECSRHYWKTFPINLVYSLNDLLLFAGQCFAEPDCYDVRTVLVLWQVSTGNLVKIMAQTRSDFGVLQSSLYMSLHCRSISNCSYANFLISVA
ncbi:hypothetical protein R3I93_001222 [Phoxinus phoxinus]|uniref:Uncharacterized protein n=1 Tax=Phoxinus phoxinus TaxID=58324 RepID=A0AAN9DN36_9TELE